MFRLATVAFVLVSAAAWAGWPPPWDRAAGDPVAAEQARRALDRARAVWGARDLAPVANALLARAREEPERAEAYGRLAVSAAPDDPAPRAFLARRALAGFQPVSAAAQTAAALVRLGRDPWFWIRLVGHGFLAATLAAWAGAVGALGWGLAVWGGLAHHDYSDAFPAPLRRYAPTGFALFSAAVLSLGGIGPLLLLWSAGLLLCPYLPSRRRWVLGGLLVVGALLPVALGVAGRVGAGPGERAWALYQVWKGAGGELVADAAAVLPPDDPRAAFARARLARRAGDYPAAAELLRQGLAAGGDPGLFWMEIGNIRFLRGDLDGALDAYGRATRYRPEDPEPWFNRHVTLLANLDLPGADDALERALALEEGRVRAFQRSMPEGSGNLVPISDPMPARWIAQAALSGGATTPRWAERLSRLLLAPGGSRLAAAMAAITALVVLLAGVSGRGRRSHRCPECGAVVCPRCGYRVKGSTLCSGCWAARNQEDADLSETEHQRAAARAWARRRARLHRWGRAIVPGWPDLFGDRPVAGAALAVLWSSGLGWAAAGLLHPAPLTATGAGPAAGLGVAAWLLAHVLGALSASRAGRASRPVRG